MGRGAEEALAAGRGVCQDQAHVFIACARSMGMPARYVSGYLRLDGRDEASATHAWAEAWVPDLGWVGFDVANRMSPRRPLRPRRDGSGLCARRHRYRGRAAPARRATSALAVTVAVTDAAQ